MALPNPAHGAEIAIELVGAEGTDTFTAVPGVNTEISYSLEHATKAIDTHDKVVAENIVAPQMRLTDISFSVAYDPTDGAHDATTGLQAHFLGVGGTTPGVSNRFAFRLRGRAGRIADDGTDQIIASAEVSQFELVNGLVAEERMANVVLTHVGGNILVDSTLYNA